MLVREQSKFIDWQKVKVQEKSDEVMTYWQLAISKGRHLA